MNKWLLPGGIALLLSACTGEEPAELGEEPQTEVSAPEADELAPPAPTEDKDAETTDIAALAEGSIEEGTAVKVAGIVGELTDDVAFPSFILINGDQQVYIRNMSETAVKIGDNIQAEGIYDGNAEEDMPLVSASAITVE